MASYLYLETNSNAVDFNQYVTSEDLLFQLHERLKLSSEKLQLLEGHFDYFITKMMEIEFQDFEITEFRK